jgi:hypothetical protein
MIYVVTILIGHIKASKPDKMSLRDTQDENPLFRQNRTENTW